MSEKYITFAVVLMTLAFATSALGQDRSHSDYYPSTLWRSGEYLSGDETAPDKHWRGRPPHQFDRWRYVDEPYLIRRWGFRPYYYDWFVPYWYAPAPYEEFYEEEYYYPEVDKPSK